MVTQPGLNIVVPIAVTQAPRFPIQYLVPQREYDDLLAAEGYCLKGRISYFWPHCNYNRRPDDHISSIERRFKQLGVVAHMHIYQI